MELPFPGAKVWWNSRSQQHKLYGTSARGNESSRNFHSGGIRPITTFRLCNINMRWAHVRDSVRRRVQWTGLQMKIFEHFTLCKMFENFHLQSSSLYATSNTLSRRWAHRMWAAQGEANNACNTSSIKVTATITFCDIINKHICVNVE